jgi:hypothetical protein
MSGPDLQTGPPDNQNVETPVSKNNSFVVIVVAAFFLFVFLMIDNNTN